MALTPSTMLPLGTLAPPFQLPDVVTGNLVTFDRNVHAPAILVTFICNHCPYVQHVRGEIARLARDYQARGVAIYGISSNDVSTHPDDRPELMAKEHAQAGYVFPYLYDETQQVAKAYRAACTPDFFVFDAGHRLVYRGQLDSSRPGNGLPNDGRDLRAALDAVLAGGVPSADQRPSIGCNIKWKAGQAPDYA
jgi:peroxiredoxin